MRYALIRNGAVVDYPYTFAKLRTDNPQVSFPRDPSDAKLAEYGVVAIAETEPPTVDLTKNAVEGTPVLSGKTWARAWSVVDASAAEIAERQADKKDSDGKAEIKADAFVQSFLGMSPAEVSAYIGANFPSLTAAERSKLSKLAIMVWLLARREFRG